MTTRFYPNNLKALPIWVLWKIEDRDGKKTKVLYSANYDGRASSTNPKTWSSFEKASRKYEAHSDEYNGLGIVVCEEYRIVFLDADHCIENGVLDERASDLLDLCRDQYVELSQSGSGIHVLAFGDIPRSFKNSENGIEMYSKGRFCALTGNALIPSELHENAPLTRLLFDKYKTREKPKINLQVPRDCIFKDDKKIIERASDRGGRFPALYRGDWTGAGYKSQSEADIALCMILAFWTDRDGTVIDRIFRSSGLYREKWERADYRNSTIETACSSVAESLSEFMDRKIKEEARELENAFINQW